MEELAEVIAVESGMISVVSQVKSSCSTCSQVSTCASGQVAKAIPHKKSSFILPVSALLSNQPVQVGDCVVLTLPEIDVLQSAWQVYLLPIIGLLVFSAVGQWLTMQAVLSHELLGLGIGLTGCYLGYRLAKYLQNHPEHQGKLQPKILRVIPKPLVVDVQ
ncbi:MAG: sigma-E factor negative regulatory protein RseC [Colwellia sp.]|jgi:sigma-E factor negative regulatory protein RseC|tara:strand:- start:6463 stop:6945 length:483 start_codon:yes stop_codon:yes gene_type:complete